MAKKGGAGVAREQRQAAGANAPKSEKTTKQSFSARVRLVNKNGQALLLSKRVSPKNGAIRVSATISQKGHKAQKIGREVYTTHVDANAALDKMTKDAQERGWTLREKGAAYVPPNLDRPIEIPNADEVVEAEAKKAEAGAETPAEGSEAAEPAAETSETPAEQPAQA